MVREGKKERGKGRKEGKQEGGEVKKEGARELWMIIILLISRLLPLNYIGEADDSIHSRSCINGFTSVVQKGAISYSLLGLCRVK